MVTRSPLTMTEMFGGSSPGMGGQHEAIVGLVDLHGYVLL
jgi:hypothetical protein